MRTMPPSLVLVEPEEREPAQIRLRLHERDLAFGLMRLVDDLPRRVLELHHGRGTVEVHEEPTEAPWRTWVATWRAA